MDNENLLSENSDYPFRKKFDTRTTPTTLASDIQAEVDHIIKTCENVDWREDKLSEMIVLAIRATLSEYIIPNMECTSGISKFDLEAYKISGKPETHHGDIAIIVTRSFDEGRPISGVGFYEAKAANIVTGKYSAFDIQQLRSLVTHTPKLSYLFYDKETTITDTQDWPTHNTYEQQNFPHEQAGQLRTNANTVDANFLKNCKDPKFAIRSVGQPFGYHLVHRILSGRDLDYSRTPIESIIRWRKKVKNANALVISVTVQDSFENPIQAQLQLPGFETIKLPELPYERKIRLCHD